MYMYVWRYATIHTCMYGVALYVHITEKQIIALYLSFTDTYILTSYSTYIVVIESFS